MDVIQPKIMTGHVMHARLFPKINRFIYGIYYLALPLKRLPDCKIPQERWAPASFYRKDHGPCDGSDLYAWAQKILRTYGIDTVDGEIMLVCLPRIFGYVFNPVSFWLCYGPQNTLRAIICEVHNTFGQRHSYLCARPDHGPITAQDLLKTEKIFHVSPFLESEGHYEFTFDISAERFSVWIDYFDKNKNKKLLTSLIGSYTPLTKPSLRSMLWKYPLVTFKAISLIHWQALKLIAKGIKYIPKPRQKPERLSATQNIIDNITEI